MNKMKLFLGFFLTILISFTLIACKDKPEVSFESDAIEIEVGDTKDLKYSVTEGYDVTFNYDEEIIEVSNRKIKGLKVGETDLTITVKDTKVKDTIKVTVIERKDVTVDTEDIVIKGSNEGFIGDEIKLSYEILPANATNQKVTWSSLNKELATVNNEGLVTLLKEGIVTIKATQNNVESEFKITIKEIEEEEVFYTVTFDTDGGNEINSLKVLEGNKATKPTEPLKDGYKFIEWQLDNETFDFNTEINNDITLVAKWEEEEDPVPTDYNIFINDTGYESISEAILAANENDVITLKEGIYTENFTVNKDNLTFTSHNQSDLAIIKGKITIVANNNGTKFNNLIFEGNSQITAPGILDNFEFSNNEVRDITLERADYVPNNRVNVNAFLRLYSLSGSNVIRNVLIENNTFNNINTDIISIDRTTDKKEINILNNEFVDFPNSAIRFDGGYNNGTYNIKGNLFKSTIINENNNAILFRAYSAEAGKMQKIYIEENEFVNVGSDKLNREDTYPGSAGIAFSVFNDQGTELYIRYNKFTNVTNTIHLRNMAVPNTLFSYINYNEFENSLGEYILYEASTTYNSDFNYNLFIDENGNEITDIDEIKEMVINNDTFNIFFEKEIDLVISKLVESIEINNVDLVVTKDINDNTENVTINGKDYVVGVSAFKTINEAINASNGKTLIYVLDGNYKENIVIDKDDITLIGNNYNINTVDVTRNAETIINGNITINNANNFTINGFKFIETSKINSNTGLNGFVFNYNVVETDLTFLSGSNIVGIIEFKSNNLNTQYKNIVLTNNYYDFTKTSSPRFLLASNVENLYIVNNYFNSSYDSFTDVVRVTGTNLERNEGGLTGKLYVYSNTFKNVGQSALFITRYYSLETKIVNNDFDNINTAAARFWASGDNKNESSFLFNYNTLNINEEDIGYINAALRVQAGGNELKVVANYNHFKTEPANEYFAIFKEAYVDARYNFYGGNVDFIPNNEKMTNIDMFDGYYLSLDDLPKYEDKLIISVDEVEILNKIDELMELDSHTLDFEFKPDNATNQKFIFESSNEDVATIDAYGKVLALKSGITTIKVVSESNELAYDEFVLEVIERERVEVNILGKTSIKVNETLKIEATKYGTDKNITYQVDNLDVGTIDQDGLIEAIGVGELIVQVLLGDDVHFEITISVTDDQISELLNLLIENSESVVEKETIKYIGSDDGSLDYDHEIIPSVNYYLFNDDLDITLNMLPKSEPNHPNIKMTSTEWIVIHDTANSSPTAGAQANSNWVLNPSNTGTSWHYTVGNDGWYKQMEHDDVAWHAGDGSNVAGFIDTEIQADEMFAPITIDGDGYFLVKGIKTYVLAPKIDGRTPTNNDIVDNNLWAVIIDGTYHIPSMRGITNYGGNVVINGGNRNGIGIETAVNRGSDVWLTWQRTAKLVAYILEDTNLSLDRVLTHNHFSAKPCPRTAMESDNMAKLYRMIELENKIRTNYKDYEINFTSHNLDILDNNGRVVNIPLKDTIVTYEISVKDSNNNIESVTLSTLVKGIH